MRTQKKLSHLRVMSGRFKRRAFLQGCGDTLRFSHTPGRCRRAALLRKDFTFFCLMEYSSCVYMCESSATHTHLCVNITLLRACMSSQQHTCGRHVVLTCASGTVVSFHHMCGVLTFSGCAHVGVCVLHTVSLNCLSLWSRASPALLSVSWKPNGLFDPIRARAKSTLPSLDPARAS